MARAGADAEGKGQRFTLMRREAIEKADIDCEMNCSDEHDCSEMQSRYCEALAYDL